jgi:hypothetical protein
MTAAHRRHIADLIHRLKVKRHAKRLRMRRLYCRGCK